MKLKEIVDNIFNLSKKIILTILENSFPRPMPYPVMRTILSYLLTVKGAGNIGLVSVDDEIKEVERNDMENLYLTLAGIYDHVKDIMFNSFTSVSSSPLNVKKAILEEMFENLVATVNSSQLQLNVEGLDIEEI